jgi:AraC-like DNA-binding protein
LGLIACKDAQVAFSFAKQRRKKYSQKSSLEEVFLSEGRFGHLFKEAIEIPSQRYLLWYRLQMALKSIITGKNFTFATHEADFTDSAHLSWTLRQMYGISLSEMFVRRDQISLSLPLMFSTELDGERSSRPLAGARTKCGRDAVQQLPLLSRPPDHVPSFAALLLMTRPQR